MLSYGKASSAAPRPIREGINAGRDRILGIRSSVAQGQKRTNTGTESRDILKEENREVAENCSTSTLRKCSWEQQRPTLLPLPTPARPARQRLSAHRRKAETQSSSKPSCLQATVPRADGSVCPMRHARSGPGLGSESGHSISGGPILAQLLAGLWSPNKPRWLRPGPWPCMPPCPPGQHPSGAGAPSGAATAAPWPPRCCPSRGVPGLGRGEARGCRCSCLGLLHLLPTTGFNQITGLFFSLLLLLYATVSIK